MGFKKLTLAEFKDLDDGRLHVAWNKGLERLVKDCLDRPGDTSPRKLTMQLAIVPVQGQEGTLEDINGHVEIKDSIPVRKSKTYSFRCNKNGDLIYSANNPSNARQTTFDDVDQVTGKVNMGPNDEDDEEDDDGDEE